jgi:hypothetical protein
MKPWALVRLMEGLERDRLSGRNPGARLVTACVDVVDVSGAGISLMVDDTQRATLGGSDDAIRLVEELQFTLGEGPCVDTYRTGRPVLEPHLGDPDVERWPEFSGPAVTAGINAIFGFPLHVGTACIGALDLYSDRSGDLRREQFTDAIIMANVVAHAVLDLPGGKADFRSAVHQASGLLSAQLDIPVGDALGRIRAHAYAEGRALDDVARGIIDRELRIEP